jgi:ATP-dependent DNA ligase
MQADEVSRPFHREGWIYEEKYDGWRMVAYKDGTAVSLVSRAGKDHSRRFPDLVAAMRALPPMTLILDGEVAIFDDKLVSRFEWFRKRPEEVAATPADLHGIRLPLPRRAGPAQFAIPRAAGRVGSRGRE